MWLLDQDRVQIVNPILSLFGKKTSLYILGWPACFKREYCLKLINYIKFIIVKLTTS